MCAFHALDGCRKAAALTLVCPSMTVRGTLVEGHLFLGGKGLSQFHNTTIWKGEAQEDGWWYGTIHPEVLFHKQSLTRARFFTVKKRFSMWTSNVLNIFVIKVINYHSAFCYVRTWTVMCTNNNKKVDDKVDILWQTIIALYLKLTALLSFFLSCTNLLFYFRSALPRLVWANWCYKLTKASDSCTGWVTDTSRCYVTSLILY